MNKKSSQLCVPSKLPASDYVINPYVGCTHRCTYCYARFMGRFTGHSEPWGTYLEPKHYDSYDLPKNIAGKTILIGSVTDAYNPGEKKFNQMPSILSALATCPAHVEILTKSDLILRDINLLKKIPDLSVGISLSNLNDEDNRILESGAPSALRRLEALRELHDNGIATYVFISPYLPGLSDLGEIASKTAGWVDRICVENLNLRAGYKQPMLDFIGEKHPDLATLYNRIYNGSFGKEYWQTLEMEMELLRSNLSIPVVSYLYHDKIRKQ